MVRPISTVLLLFSFFLASCPSSMAADGDMTEDVEALALLNRKKIESCEVAVSIERVNHARNTTWRYMLTHRISGNKVLEISDSDFGDNKMIRRVIGQNCNEKSPYVLYNNGNVVRFAEKPVDDRMIPSDPRMVGFTLDCYTMSQSCQNRLDVFVGSQDSQIKSITPDNLGGTKVIRIHRERPNGLQFTIWVAPDHNYSIVRIEGADKAGHSWKTSINHDYDSQSKLWLPVSFHSVAELDNQPLRTSRGKLKWQSVNGPIPPERFTLAHLGIPKGTIVQDYLGKPGRFVWDGEDATQEAPLDPIAQAVQPPVFSPTPRYFTWLWRLSITLGSLAVLVGIYFLYQRWRKKGAIPG